jgi:hypothetical protein
MIVITEKSYKKFKHYSISEIKHWQIVQLQIKQDRIMHSYATHIRVLRIDPTWTGKIIWDGICSQKWEEYLFHVEFIYRNYTLDPIIIWESDHKKRGYKEFSRKILI